MTNPDKILATIRSPKTTSEDPAMAKTSMLDIHQFAAAAQAGDQFRFHPADPHELPRPDSLLTVSSAAQRCPDGQCIHFQYPPEFTAKYGFSAGSFCVADVDVGDRFEIAGDQPCLT